MASDSQCRWKSYALQDIAEFQNGHAFYKDGYSTEGLIAIDLLNIDEEGRLRLSDRDKRVSPELCERYSKFKLDRNDLVIAMTDMTQRLGILGKCAIIDRSNAYILNQRIGRIRANESIVLTRYLHYFINSDLFLAPLHAVAKGAVQKYVNTGDIKDNHVAVPPLNIQRGIVSILLAYDDLIENNQRRIRILEGMARALYREWFVHFRFAGHEKLRRVASPLGDIPQGWEVRTVKDVATVTYGFPFASEKFNTDGIGTSVIRIRDIPEGFSPTFTDEHAEPKYHVKNGHILVGMDGDFHMCIWSSGHAFQNQRVARFESNGEIGNLHLFLALEKPIQEFNKAIVGTTVAHLGDMHIKTIQIVWPPAKLRAEAREVLEPMSKQIIALKRQIQNLRRTRHLLLPRLLSGQVEVIA